MLPLEDSPLLQGGALLRLGRRADGGSKSGSGRARQERRTP